MRAMISAVVLTKNAERTIKFCLRSLAFANERIVIDDRSSDKTVALAKRLGAHVYERGLAGDFAAARNFGLQKASQEWVLFVDADEQVSQKLAGEIQQKLASVPTQVRGFYLKRRDTFLGRRLDHGETAAVRLLRLARRGSGQWQGEVHEVWKVKGRVENLDAPLDHDRNLNLSQFMTRLAVYAQIKAQERYRKHKQESLFRVFLNPLSKFIQNYFWRLGFLDGFPGLVMAWFMSWHSLLVRIWLRLLWRNHGKDTFVPNPKLWQ